MIKIATELLRFIENLLDSNHRQHWLHLGRYYLCDLEYSTVV